MAGRTARGVPRMRAPAPVEALFVDRRTARLRGRPREGGAHVREIEVSREALVFRTGDGDRTVPWDRVREIHPATYGLRMVLADGDALLLEGLRGHPEGLLDAMRRSAQPGTFRLSQADEVRVLGGDAPHRIHRQPTSAVATPDAADGYRSAGPAPKRTSAPIALGRPLPLEAEEAASFQRIASGLGLCVFGAVVSTAAPAPVTVGVIGVLALVSLVLVAGLFGSARDRRARRELRKSIADWLGRSTQLDARGMLLSADGKRRVRQLPDDLDDPHAGPHLHYETLDPERGVVLTTSSELQLDLGLPTAMRPFTSRSVARVVGTRTTTLRSSRDDAAPDVEAAARAVMLVVDVGADGAILRRLGPGNAHLGDTFHETEADAREQAAREHEHGPWCLARVDDPWTLHTALDAAETEASDERPDDRAIRSRGSDR